MTLDAQKVQLIDRIIELEERVRQALWPIVPKEWLSVDLTMPQLKIILLIFTDGPARTSTLASALGVSLATTSGITDRLVQHGLIVRGDDPEDRRAVVCSLSEKGTELMKRLWELGQSRLRSLLEKMTPPKLEIISEAMEVILQTASAVQEDTITKVGAEP